MGNTVSENKASTKERILVQALDMFSKEGYNAVSIRDIAGAVNIKESSIYYHFKNKQDILDSLVQKYENYIEELVDNLQEAAKSAYAGMNLSPNDINRHFFEKYLFDPFCNQMMRLMTIEQFHNEEMAKLYNQYLFEIPYTYQIGFLQMLVNLGAMDDNSANSLGQAYFSVTSMLTFKYLLCGEFTDEKKHAFIQEANDLMIQIFEE